MTTLKPHRILDVTETTRVRHFRLGYGPRTARVALCRGFRLVLTFAALALMGCSAMPARGPRAVRIDPAFTAEQAQAISDAVDAWDLAAGLTVAVSSWDDTDVVPIMRDDTLVARESRLGETHSNSKDHSADTISIAGAGSFKSGHTVADFDFQSTAAHELGHLFGLNAWGDKGCDGDGHSADASALMYGGAPPVHTKIAISAADAARVEAVVEQVW